MPLMEKGGKQNSGIAIVVWFCLDRVTIPSQAEGLCPSKYHYLFLITFTPFYLYLISVNYTLERSILCVSYEAGIMVPMGA